MNVIYFRGQNTLNGIESGSFRSYFRSVKSFRPELQGGSFQPNFRGESFQPDIIFVCMG